MNEKRYRIIIKAESNDLPTLYEAWHVILEGHACVSGTPRRERSPRETNPSRHVELSLTVTASPVDTKRWAEVIDIILYEDYGMPCAVFVEEEEEIGTAGIVG